MKTKKLKVLDLKKTTITVLKHPELIMGGAGRNPFERNSKEASEPIAKTISKTGPGDAGTFSNTHKGG